MMKKLVRIVVVVFIVIVVVTGFDLYNKNNSTEINVTALSEQIKKCSSLTTARLEHRGLLDYSSGNIPFLTKKGFLMLYSAEITAGINLSDVNITVDDHNIQVKLPDPEIQTVTVDPKSIQFFDKKKAIFNWASEEDVPEALSYAEDDARKAADESDLLSQSSEQARTVVESIFSPLTDTEENPYELNFVD